MALIVAHSKKPSGSATSAKGGGLTFALQALLDRHESYMASSESDRLRLNTTILNLESEKSTLQAANDRIVAENQSLLDQLEGLNSTLATTDGHIKNLEGTLASAQLEIRRLAVLAARTEELERQLMQMERSMIEAEEELGEQKEEGRSALRRWREAEGRVRVLEIEVERIETEAKGERERHEEVLGRMERRGMIERELGNAEGRLKNAATVAGLNGTGNGKRKDEDGVGGTTSVVSHFVKDILQDNANLQAGIVELRELLQTSNEEVQNLREQIMLHQPVDHPEREDESNTAHMVSLDEQLWGQQPQQVSQEVHVHHHYHAKFASRKDRAPVARRQSRKRTSVGNELSGLTPESSIPSTPLMRPQTHISSPLLPAVSTRHPAPRARAMNRWSVQSAATASTLSSLPSSPRSYFDQPGDSSIFDRFEREEESSRPTSPESAGGYGSPIGDTGIAQRKGRLVDFPLMSFKEIDEEGDLDQNLTPRPVEVSVESDVAANGGEVREEEDQSPLGNSISPSDIVVPADAANFQQLEPVPPDPINAPRLLATFEDADLEEIRPLRRSASHDSLVSISGMDIHLAKRKPSQIFVVSRGVSFPTPASVPSFARKISGSHPLASIAEVTASPSKRSFGSDEISASLAMLNGIAGTTSRPPQVASSNQSSGLGRLVGGWVRGKWGVAPMKSNVDLRGQTAANIFACRSPGINQTGGIRGLKSPDRTPSEVHVKVLDASLLNESLAE